jgi:hypothetical protein
MPVIDDFPDFGHAPTGVMLRPERFAPARREAVWPLFFLFCQRVPGADGALDLPLGFFGTAFSDQFCGAADTISVYSFVTHPNSARPWERLSTAERAAFDSRPSRFLKLGVS